MSQGYRQYARVYQLFWKASLLREAGEKADFLSRCLGKIVFQVFTIASAVLIYQKADWLGGLNVGEYMTMYGFVLVSISPAALFLSNLWFLRFQVEDGSFTRIALFPMNRLFLFCAERVDITGLLFLAIGIVVIYQGYSRSGLSGTGLNWLLAIGVCLLGAIAMCAFLVIAASACFWTRHSIVFLLLYWRLQTTLRFPIISLGPVLYVILVFFIPLALCGYFPVLILRNYESLPIVWLSSIIVVLFVMLSALVWQRGVQRYLASI